MARCPNCNARLEVSARRCKACRTKFGGSIWKPIADTPAEAAALEARYPGRDAAEPRRTGRISFAFVLSAAAGAAWLFRSADVALPMAVLYSLMAEALVVFLGLAMVALRAGNPVVIALASALLGACAVAALDATTEDWRVRLAAAWWAAVWTGGMALLFWAIAAWGGGSRQAPAAPPGHG
jgi:hypothetical protein